MNDPDKTFIPERVDQQIDQPAAGLPRGSARLVHDLQAMYDQENDAAIDRVWERIAHRSSAAHPQPELLSRREGRREPIRSFSMQQIDRTTKPTKRLSRTLGLIAAALIGVVLVGSLTLILAAQKNTATPGLGASHPTSTVQKSAAAATASPAIPAQCQDTTFRSDETLCATGQETILNITKHFGSRSVTFVRAYADSNQMLLVYKINNSYSDAISFTSITIQQGVVIGLGPGEAGGGGSFSNPSEGYLLETFSIQRVPVGSTEVRVQAIVDGFSGTTTPLSFAVPIHTEHKTVIVNQTVTSKGVALTLERLEFTESTLTFVFSPKLTFVFSPKLATPQTLDQIDPFIFINGQKIPLSSGGTAPDGAFFYQALMGHSGTWKIQVHRDYFDSLTPFMQHQHPSQQITWTFQFII